MNDQHDVSGSIGSELSTLVFELMAEGQRALVIAGAARLDVSLEDLLKRSMRYRAGANDDLFRQDGPLGTFSAKIALAHRLGLIADEVEGAIDLVRRIRNDFAHSVG